jgi:hypothetical protein
MPIDTTDLGMVALTWALTWLVGKLINKVSPATHSKMRALLPSVTVLLGVLLTVSYEYITAAATIDGGVILQGALRGAAAVLGHSQIREVLKVASKPKVDAVTPALILLIGLSLAGCPRNPVVHDSTNYKSQLAWLEARNAEDIEAFERAINGANAAGDTESCLIYAEQLLIAKYATSWRYGMMRHLADLGEDPGAPSVVPEAVTLCPPVESLPEED